MSLRTISYNICVGKLLKMNDKKKKVKYIITCAILSLARVHKQYNTVINYMTQCYFHGIFASFSMQIELHTVNDAAVQYLFLFSLFNEWIPPSFICCSLKDDGE